MSIVLINSVILGFALYFPTVILLVRFGVLRKEAARPLPDRYNIIFVVSGAFIAIGGFMTFRETGSDLHFKLSLVGLLLSVFGMIFINTNRLLRQKSA